MLTFQVDDMSCGHCVATITRAVKDADARADIEIDLGRHLVRIRPAQADAATLADAIAQAGYTPVPVPAEP